MKGSSAPIRNTRKGNKPWLLDLRYLGGKREFYETEDAAIAARRAKMDQVRRYGSSALALSNDERIDFVRARETLRDYGVTISDAVAFFVRNHRKAEPMPFSLGIQQLIQLKQSTGKDDEYVRKLGSHLNSLRLSCGDKTLCQVKRADIEKWLFGNGWAPATMRGMRIDCRTFFKFAQVQGWIVDNPAAQLERITIPDRAPGILTVEDATTLLRATLAQRKALLPFLVLNLFCGLRPEETVQLTAGNILLDRGFVDVPAKVAKSRKRRLVDISENAKAWLNLAPFVPRSGKWYARQIIKARHDAGLKVWPHDCLRHSFASYHLALHGSAEKTALQMGHRSTEMLFRHYRELVVKADALRFWSIVPP